MSTNDLEESLKYAQQTHIECDGCDEVTSVENYCITCKANLCEKCKNTRLHRSHTVLPWLHSEAIKVRRHISTSCKYHPETKYSKYCNACKIACCQICIEQYHKNHDLSDLSEKKEQIINETSTIFDELVKITLPSLRSKTSAILKIIDSGEDYLQLNRKRISYCAQNLMGQVADYEAESMTDLENAHEKWLENLKVDLEETIRKEELAEALVQAYQNNFTTSTVAELSVLQHKATQIEELKEPHFSYPEFVESEFQLPEKEVSLGKIKTKPVCAYSQVSDEDCLHQVKLSLLPVLIVDDGRNGVWIYQSNPPTIALMDDRYKIVKEFSCMNFTGIARSPSCGVYGIDYSRKSIMQVSNSERRIVLKTFSHFYPTAVCFNYRQELVVALEKEFLQSPFKIVVYSAELDKIAEVENDQNGKPFFPTRIQSITCSSKNKMIIAEKSTVQCVNERSKQLWKFSETKCDDSNSNYTCVKCDMFDNVFVCDDGSKAVCILSASGSFIGTFLRRPESTAPISMTIDSTGNIWIGLMNKTIQIYRGADTSSTSKDS